jgi:peptidoglycan-associated lipoprotein
MKGKKMRLQILSALAAAVLLAACSSDQPVETANQAGAGAGTGTANSAGVTSQYTPGSKGQFDAEVGNTVYFATDRYDLSGEAQAQLQQYPASTMTVEGHCDERGTREYNLALGERRANSVANYLVALGLDKARISVISYGKERPICSESDEGCYSQNRRGVTAINQ